MDKKRNPPMQVKPATINLYSYPEKRVNDSTMQKLFLTVQEGDISRIKNFIISNNISGAVRLEDGNTLLHIVLESNVKNKYEIIKFLIENGAYIDLPNAYNVTPLHIACKQQQEKIVKLLIENGANVNFADSQGMTPLHYQIMTKIEACKSKNEVKSLVPSPKNKDEYDNYISEINNLIISLLYKDDETNTNLLNIKNTLSNLQNMYPQELEKIQKNYEDKIKETMVNKEINENEKSKLLFDLVLNCKNEIYDLVKNKLSKVLNESKIGIQTGGNKLFSVNVNDYLEDISDKLDNDRKNAISDIENSSNQIISEFKEIESLPIPLFDKFEGYVLSLALTTDEEDYFVNLTGRPINDFWELDLLTKNQVFNDDISNTLRNKYPDFYNNIGPMRTFLVNNFWEKIYYFINKLKSHWDFLTDEGRFNIENEDYAGIINNIYLNTIYILNMLLYFGAIENEYVELSEKISKIKQEFGGNEEFNYFINDFKKIDTKIKVIYDNLQKIVINYNDLIKITNKKSAINLIIEFNKNNGEKMKLENLYDRSFELLLEPFLDINKIREILPNNDILKDEIMVDNIKKIVIDTYIPQYTYKNYGTYYSDDDFNGNPRIGFPTIIYDNNNNYSLKYGDRTKYYDDIDINYLQPSNNVKVGNLGYKKSFDYEKKNMMFPVVESLLDEHLFVIKYKITKNFLEEYEKQKKQEEKKGGAINMDSDEGRNLLFHMLQYKKKYMENTFPNIISNDNSDEYINILLSKIIDSILNNFIKISINRGAIFHTLHPLNGYKFDNNKFYNEFLNDAKVNLLKLESEFKVSLNNLIKSLWGEINNFNNTQIIVKELEKDEKQYKIYNYSSNKQSSDCFKLNPEITEYLIKNNAAVNKKNIIGNTPLFYAIKLQQNNVIKILLKYGASINSKLSTNIMNMTPFKLSLLIYDDHINFFKPFSNTTDQYYKKITDFITTKPEYQNNILRYSDNIFSQILFMINNYLYTLSKQYPRNWSYANYKKLMEIINEPMENMKNVKIISETFLSYLSSSKLSDILSDEKFITDKISSLQNEINEIDLRIKSLNDDNDQNTQEINDLISKLESKKQSLKNKIIEKEKNLENYKNDNDVTKMKNELENRKKILNNTNNYDVVNIYDTIFNNVINSEIEYTTRTNLLLYPYLWQKYINDIKNNPQNANISLIHLFLLNKQNIFLEEINNLDFIKTCIVTNDDIKNISIIINKMNPFIDFHKYVMYSFANDYEDLPNEYNGNTNYSLKIVMDIIIHTIRHTLCTMFYNVIYKVLTKYIISINIDKKYEMYGSNGEKYKKYITEVINSIINNNTSNNLVEKKSSLLDYIMNVLPTKIVKKVLNIYRHDNDPDIYIPNVDSLFDNVTKILLLNNTVPLNRDSSLIGSLQNYVYPYFKDIFTLFITESKIFVDNYMKYLINETQQLEIIREMLIGIKK